ncbi:ankyrin [Ascodesmis nigricans]|uniref:Ankyrin n=1 Tax=Ascodesmis nigricans TaxID=341454 RepID=A0A4S2N2P0_9PEZI|nr:ankyrin [Ascodesmis nigricans]
MSNDSVTIHEACRNGQLAIVESLLSTNPKLANELDSDDRLPIHWACSFNHLDIATLLTQQPKFDVDVQDGMGWTPLMIACSVKEGEKLVELLLSRGADVNAKNNSLQTALHFIASKNNIHVARLLLDAPHKASARVRDKRGQYPLHRAAAVGATVICGLLLDHNSPINASDNDGLTALHHAIAEGHGDTAMLLLRRGAESDKKDADGRLPIEGAPDRKVGTYILSQAKEEGIEVAMPE